MELLIPIPLVISLSRLAGERERIAAGVAAAIMIGTIFLSGSRGGMLAILVEFAVARNSVGSPEKSRPNRHRRRSFCHRADRLADLAGRKRTDRARLQRIGWKPAAKSRVECGSPSTAMPSTCSAISQCWAGDSELSRSSTPSSDPSTPTSSSTRPTTTICNYWRRWGFLGFAAMIWFLIVLYRNALRKIGNWMSD